MVIAACDTDDGREMQAPGSYARFQLSKTTTTSSTSTTVVVPVPTEFIPVATSTTPGTSSTTSTAFTTTTSAGSTTTSPVPAAPPPESTSPAPAAAEAAQLQFIGPWDDGAAIPIAYTCEGTGDAPLITWTAPPEGTAELALSDIDADANGFVHWLVVGLPPQAGSVGGGEPLVDGAAEGINGFDNPGWGGPCPPPGGGPHTYLFTLHLLDQAVELPADAPANDLVANVDAATASSVTFTGTYERA